MQTAKPAFGTPKLRGTEANEDATGVDVFGCRAEKDLYFECQNRYAGLMSEMTVANLPTESNLH